VSIPGIGKKLAERVIFELKEKVAAAGAAVIAVAGQPVAENDVVGALQALGYSLPEAREAARHGLQIAGVGSSLEERVKAALRVLARD
jgi:Holliday junction DNA helicase RuvA